jgi:hypothetical protein
MRVQQGVANDLYEFWMGLAAQPGAGELSKLRPADDWGVVHDRFADRQGLLAGVVGRSDCSLRLSLAAFAKDTAGRCCVVRSGGSLNLFPWSDQIPWVSSVKAARTRKFSGSSIPSS